MKTPKRREKNSVIRFVSFAFIVLFFSKQLLIKLIRLYF